MYPQQNPFDAAAAGQPSATYPPQGQANPPQPMRPVASVGGVSMPAGAKGRRRFGPLGPSPIDFLPHPFRRPWGFHPMGTGRPPFVGFPPWAAPGTTPGGKEAPGQWIQPTQAPPAFAVPGGRWVFVPDEPETTDKAE